MEFNTSALVITLLRIRWFFFDEECEHTAYNLGEDDQLVEEDLKEYLEADSTMMEYGEVNETWGKANFADLI